MKKMKKIIKQFALLAITFLVAVSCNWDDSENEILISGDDGGIYYLQFKNDVVALEIGISPSGDPVEAEPAILLSILGYPLDQDLTVNLSIDPSSTATSDMYQLGSTTLVIPAGEVTASTTFTTVSENMPVGDVVTLTLNADAASVSTQITFSLLRPVPCAWVPGIYTVKMVDTYGDGWQTETTDGGRGIQVTVDGVLTAEVGMCTNYEPSPFVCVEGPESATATVEIPVGAQSVTWYFPGDTWGEIEFQIIDPDGNTVYSVEGGNGEAGFMDFQVCSNK